MKRALYFGVSVFFIVILISMVSAGFFSSLTGKATSQPTNVSVSFKDISPAQVTYVSPITGVNPLELNQVAVSFAVQVYNFDKLGDINFSSVFANFSNNGVTRGPVQCINVNNITNRIANFSCTINMWYWDAAGGWNISVVASDIGNGTKAYNATTYFTYNQLKAMVLSPPALTWPVLTTGEINSTSNNDPSIINNTGNYNGTVQVTGFDLAGETDSNDTFAVGNFSSSILTSSNECGITTSNLLANNSAITITNAVPNPGNLSAGGGVGQEEIYYCIRQVPVIPTQTYSTAAGGLSWIVAYGA